MHKEMAGKASIEKSRSVTPKRAQHHKVPQPSSTSTPLEQIMVSIIQAQDHFLQL